MDNIINVTLTLITTYNVTGDVGFTVSTASPNYTDFLASTESFNVSTAGFTVSTAGFNVSTEGVNVSTQGFNVSTAGFNVSTEIFNVFTEIFNASTVTYDTEASTRWTTKEIARMIHIVVRPILIVFGTVGNALTFYIMRTSSLRKRSTCFYMAVLALTDTGKGHNTIFTHRWGSSCF